MDKANFHHLYDDGQQYDQLFAPEATGDDLACYTDMARRTDGPVLELACGTGRVLIPLARRGCDVVGIDLSAAMLDTARRKSAAEGLTAEWIQGDIRDFDLERTFGLIYLPNNTLCHLLDHQAFTSCMACVKKHLQPDGRFVVEVFIPNPELLLDKPGERFPFGEFEDPDGRKVVVTHSYVYELDTQIKRITTYTRIDDNEEVAGTLDMRMYYPQELDVLLEFNGFSIEHKYGGYDRRPFDARAATQLVVCGKK
jgi:SAM-dependent methyltransferase